MQKTTAGVFEPLFCVTGYQRSRKVQKLGGRGCPTVIYFTFHFCSLSTQAKSEGTMAPCPLLLPPLLVLLKWAPALGEAHTNYVPTLHTDLNGPKVSKKITAPSK